MQALLTLDFPGSTLRLNAADVLRVLLFALLLTLAGCASRDEEPAAPPIVVPPATWELVDWDIINASSDAKGMAAEQARIDMDYWRLRIYQQTESTFIPWYSGYWTQQWLGAKVAWYNVSEAGETLPTVNRLTAYLEEQYQEQVLSPVAEEISPSAIRKKATRLYVERLGMDIKTIAQRREVPQDQLDQRLKSIPAIALAPADKRKEASLYALIQAKKLDKLPAYKALNQHILTLSALNASASSTGISGLARSESERLETQLAARGAASTVSAVVGRVASLILSVGATTYGAVAHQFGKPEIEAQLRTTMNKAFDEDWQALMDNPHTGVLAEVHYLSGQIEGDRLKAVALPLDLEPVSPGVAIPAAPALQIDIQQQDSIDYLDDYKAD